MAGGMRRDYTKLLRGGGGGGGVDMKKAAAFDNVISYLLFKVPLCHICLPYLHIVLGIVKKHDMPEYECHELDKDIATCLAQLKKHDMQRHSNMFGTALESMSPNSGVSKSVTWCFTPSQPVRLPNLGGCRETAGKKSKAFQDFLVRYKMKRDKLSIVKRNAMMRMIVNITDGIRQQNKLD